MEKYLSENSLRRWRLFKSRKLAFMSLWILLFFVFLSFTAEMWANSKPILMRYKGEIYIPIYRTYHPSVFGEDSGLVTDYRVLKMQAGDWAIWPPIKWDPLERNNALDEYPSPPSKSNLFGTDESGRDLLSRLIYGFRYSFIFAFGLWLLESLLGFVIGSAMGFLGGRVDLYGQRFVEIFESMPFLLILLTLFSIFYPSLGILIVITAALSWTRVGHYMRAEMLRLRRLTFVEAARAQGASRLRILFVHCLPNGLTPWITLTPFLISGAISTLAILDYLGFGVPAPTPSWGELLNQSKKHFTTAWWLALYPSLALFSTLAVLNTIGEGVREAFDPRAQR